MTELSIPLAYESAAGRIDPSNRTDPRNFDVAGVRLGMTPEEAARALQAAGYTKTSDRQGQPSYDTKVRNEWASKLGKSAAQAIWVPDSIDWEKGRQRVAVAFVALPEGARANAIDYWGDEDALSEAAFVQLVERKYGEPVNEDATDLRWCTTKAPDCEDPRSAKLPVLSAWTGTRSLHLVGKDRGRDAALNARFAADVAKRQPKEADVSF